MDIKIGQSIDVYSLNELPLTTDDLKFFACVGGTKNYQCFLETKKLSRAEFMKKYSASIDRCHVPIYEDEDIVITQDAQIPIPGFYIIATKKIYKRISDMELSLYQKCMQFSAIIKKEIIKEFGVNRCFMYYDEHYNKPSSVHFWVMPIYEEVLEEYKLDATILSYDVWKYQELFEFQYSKDMIYEMNDRMRVILNRYKED